MNLATFTDDEITRWLWLRAVEWGSFPSYLSQLFVPILLLFYPWYFVIGGVVAASLLWCLVRYSFVSPALAGAVVLPVLWLKWPVALGSSIYLFAHGHWGVAMLGLVWPLVAAFTCPPANVGPLQRALAQRLGLSAKGSSAEDVESSESGEQRSKDAMPEPVAVRNPTREDFARICYRIAYHTLPGMALNDSDDFKKYWDAPDQIGRIFCQVECKQDGFVPTEEQMASLKFLDASVGGLECHVIGYPKPPPPDLSILEEPERYREKIKQGGKPPVLGPHFSAIVSLPETPKRRCFILGQSPDDGTTLREVSFKDGGIRNANLGPGCPPEITQFLGLLRRVIESERA